MFRTLTSRGLGVCLKLGQPLNTPDLASSLNRLQLNSNLRFHHFSRFCPLTLASSSSSSSSTPSFPTAASHISTRLFHGQTFLASTKKGNLYVDDDDVDDGDFQDQYIDLDEPVDVVPARPDAGRSSARIASGYAASKKSDAFDGEDDDEPRALNRGRAIEAEDKEEQRGSLPDELTSLLTTYRSQATTHNEELELSRSEHASDRSFDDFGLEDRLIGRLRQLKYGSPFEIQAKTMTALMDGKDVVGQAVTGSGKTLAFGIPIVNALIKTREPTKRASSQPKALILTPTRELCNQITGAISELDPSLKCMSLYGGRPMTTDLSNIRRGVDVLCATPGRLRDHIRRQSLSLDSLKFLVLDEADEMLKDSWIADLEDILRGSPADKQVILFSATMPREIYEVAENFLQRELEVIRVKDVESNDNAPSAVNHLSLFVPSRDRVKTVKDIISHYEPKSTIVFVPTRRGTMEVADSLRRMGVRSPQVLQGDMSQTHRDGVIRGFREGKFPVLVATDVAARGLDIPNVELIVQIGLPNGLESYLHRSGRTGRAGKAGLAILVHSASKQELDFVRDLKRKIRNLKELDLADRRSFGGGGQYDGERRGGGFGSRYGRYDDYGGRGGGGGGFQRRVNDYGEFQRRGGRNDFGGGFRSRGGDRYGSDDEFGFDRQRGGGRGGGGYGRGGGGFSDRRSGFSRRDDYFDEDEFGGESRKPARNQTSSTTPSDNPSWMQGDDLQQNFKSFMNQRTGGGGGRGSNRSSRKDEDDDFW